MSFDIFALALKDTFTLKLKHPVTLEPLLVDGDEDKPVAIELYGTASKQYCNAISAMQTRALRRQAKKEKPTADQIKEESISLLVACSAGSQNLSVDGVEHAGDAYSFKSLYADPRFSWIKDQVDEALGDIGNFLEA